jgi:hypothetical protein
VAGQFVHLGGQSGQVAGGDPRPDVLDGGREVTVLGPPGVEGGRDRGHGHQFGQAREDVVIPQPSDGTGQR